MPDRTADVTAATPLTAIESPESAFPWLAADAAEADTAPELLLVVDRHGVPRDAAAVSRGDPTLARGTGPLFGPQIHPDDRPTLQRVLAELAPGDSRVVAIRLRERAGWRRTTARLTSLLDDPRVDGAVLYAPGEGVAAAEALDHDDHGDRDDPDAPGERCATSAPTVTGRASADDAGGAPLAGRTADAVSWPLLAREQAARAALATDARRLRFLGAAAAALAEPLDLPAALARLAGLLVPELGACALVELVDERGRTTLAAAGHVDRARTGALETLWARLWPAFALGDGEPPAAAATWHAGAPVAATGPLAAALAALGVTGALRLPLRARGRTVGALGLLATAPGWRYDAALVALATGVGHAAALALDTTRLHDVETRGRTAAEEAAARFGRLHAATAGLATAVGVGEVAAAAVAGAMTALGADGGLLALVERGVPPLLEVRAQRGWSTAEAARWQRFPLDDGPLSDVVRGREPIHLADLGAPAVVARYPLLASILVRRGYQAFAAAPLLIDGAPAGVLALAFTAPQPFGPDACSEFALLADHAAQTLSRARLYEAERRALGEAQRAQLRADVTQARLTLLAEAGAIVADGVVDPGTPDRLAALLVPVLGDWAAVDLAGRDGVVRRVGAAHVDPARLDDVRGLSATAPAAPPPSDGRPPGAVLVVPLLARGRALGRLVLGRTWTHDHGPEERATAEELARRVAVAVDRGHLYDDARAAVAERDRFLAIAAHELRNPLTAALSTTELLARRAARGTLDPAQLPAQLEAIRRQLRRLGDLTTDLLDGGTAGGGLPHRPEPCDLAALLREHLAACRSAWAALPGAPALVARGLTRPCPLLADPARLGQVVTNLLDNARKYSPAGGTVHVTLATRGAAALLEIADEGIGLPPGAQETVFEPFGRAENARAAGIAGSGLGLHVCREIVARHGGRLTAASAGEGRGTLLTLWLPLAEAPPAA